MISDFNIEGVFIPGLLVFFLVSLACTLILMHFMSLRKIYRGLPYRPMIDLSIFIIIFYLLLQGLNKPGLFK